MRSDFSVNRVVTRRLPVYSVFVRYPCMAINDIVQYTPTFFWLPKSISLYGSIVLLSTLILSSLLCTTVGMLGYDWQLCMVIDISVQYNGGLLPDIILLTQ